MYEKIIYCMKIVIKCEVNNIRIHCNLITHTHTRARAHTLLREYFIVYKYKFTQYSSEQIFNFLVKLNFINPLSYFSLTN